MGDPSSKAERLFDEAIRREEAGDFPGAFRCLLAGAALPHWGIQLSLGNFYSEGKGVERDLNEAAKWYRRAYQNGASSGANNLAIDLRNQGRIREAITWFQRAARMGDGDACVELAKLLKDRPRGPAAAIRVLKRVVLMSREDITDDGREEARELLRELDRSRKGGSQTIAGAPP